MAQGTFGKQVEEAADSVPLGIVRFLADRPSGGERKTDATLRRMGARVLLTVEAKVSLKRVSNLWAEALPTAAHRRDVAGIHDALLGLADELKRRNQLADHDLADVPRQQSAGREGLPTLLYERRKVTLYNVSVWP
ncbi:hypothetical protein [Streptomyces pratensis]|uniref:hypothetical protein n=1 Tax=Streptomyces pratensis TaxID=1169025 RepID=UPI0030170416